MQSAVFACGSYCVCVVVPCLGRNLMHIIHLEGEYFQVVINYNPHQQIFFFSFFQQNLPTHCMSHVCEVLSFQSRITRHYHHPPIVSNHIQSWKELGSNFRFYFKTIHTETESYEIPIPLKTRKSEPVKSNIFFWKRNTKQPNMRKDDDCQALISTSCGQNCISMPFIKCF